MKIYTKYALIVLFASFVTSCKNNEAEKDETTKINEKEQSIITLSGTLTEIVFDLGLGDKIVGVDVTSTYPEAVHQLPKLGHVSNIQAEGIIALNPTILLAEDGVLSGALLEQLKQAKIEIQMFERDYSVAGTKKLIQEVATALNAEIPKTIFDEIDAPIAALEKLNEQPKVLFIYGRGAGNLMVAGDNTQMKSIIELAGGENAVEGFENFKPLSNEVLVAANPDIVLLFDSGAASLNGTEGILAIPGMKATKAGKNKQFITMDGQLLSGFGPRLGEAILTLNKEMAQIINE